MAHSPESTPNRDPLVILTDPSAPIVRPSNVSMAMDGAAKFKEAVLGVEFDTQSGEFKLKIVD